MYVFIWLKKKSSAVKKEKTKMENSLDGTQQNPLNLLGGKRKKETSCPGEGQLTEVIFQKNCPGISWR